MKVLRQFLSQSKAPMRTLIFMACLAGLSSAMVLAVINVAAEHASHRRTTTAYFFLFATLVALYAVCQRHVMLRSTEAVEQLLHDVRMRMASQVRMASLSQIEHIGRAEIYAAINKDTLTISAVASTLVIGAQAAILVVFTVLYLAWLSFPAFVCTVLFSALTLSIYFKRLGRLSAQIHATLRQENRLFDSLTDVLDGFKEAKMHSARSAELASFSRRISEDVTEKKIATERQMTTLFVYSQTVFYMLLALMVFVVPEVSPTHSRVIVKISAAILFMLGPISSAVGAMPEFAKANAAAESILEMDRLLSRATSNVEQDMAAPPTFSEIRMQDVYYEYRDASKAPTFSAGPFNLELKKGELLFISGGNGSGKSTFLKLLTALYQPETGTLQVDGIPVLPQTRQRYRNLFAVIFADFHLFSRPFGLGQVDQARFDDLLDLMELRGITGLVNGVFEPLDLSTGQRKRLALIVATLEDRPIYVFDEWAADQDPVFRRKFYVELLARFKREGKTVIAVTHDDKYYYVANRVLRMEEGHFVPIEGSDHAD